MKNALRIFSQDRTGLADYALESGGTEHHQDRLPVLFTSHDLSLTGVCARPAGGSILSTRCSETYETKAALLSLFGVPLWYFSQSPRAVIQVTRLF